MEDEKITVYFTDYLNLLERDRILSALEMAGVDSWEGYEEASKLVEDIPKPKIEITFSEVRTALITGKGHKP